MSDTQPNDKSFPRMPTKGRLFGQKPPLKPREVWSIRVRLQISGNKRDLALFNLAIDSKLRSCDLVTLRVALMRRSTCSSLRSKYGRTNASPGCRRYRRRPGAARAVFSGPGNPGHAAPLFSRRELLILKRLRHPPRGLETATPGIVLQGNRREHHRPRR